MGVISEPPPMPVIPTRRPVRSPTIVNFQSTVTWRGQSR